MSLQNGTRIQLGTRLASAGEGTVHDVVGRPEWVAKIFHLDLKGLVAKREKVTAMTLAKPAGAVSRDGSIVLTWPQHLVLQGGVVLGYVMHKVDTNTTVEIHSISNPTDRRGPLPNQPQWPKRADWAFLLNTAANLCIAVEAAHRVGAVIGDFQERNILVSDTSRVTLVDCDSMQFTATSGRRYLCDVGRPEFTAPELRNVDLKRTPRSRSSDLFALAVHLHLLLMNGNHPFSRGVWTGPGEQPGASVLAAGGHWAGGPRSLLRTHRLAPPPSILPDPIQTLFAQAFTYGAANPALRPSARDWRQALRAITIVTCRLNPIHRYPSHNQVCPWCVLEQAGATRRSALRKQSTFTPRPAPAAATAQPRLLPPQQAPLPPT
ncbi:hypothetical protein, partial [Frankia tisae]|uniref:hypothetical protein n=1 Tax=Frankia tisae TaxID=2950104 RepID=UPI00355812F5